MNPTTTASVTCPACGQAFLSMQNDLAGMAQCPHCAHNAPRAHFGTQIQVMGVAQVRRQVAQTQPLPQMMPPPGPAAPQPAAWPGLQPMPAATPAATIARTTLQPSQALMPVGEPPPAPAQETAVPPHLRASPWKGAFFLLAFLSACGVGAWMWRDHTNVPVPVVKPAPRTPSATEAIAPAASPVTLKAEPPDMTAVTADAKALVTEIFAADTPARRAACVHEAAAHEAEIGRLFGGAAAERPKLRLLARIPGFPLMLPGGQPVPLFKLVTSKCSHGALIRLETGEDGKRRIDWPLFHETHEAALQQFLRKDSTEDAAWFHVGLRPSHGLDIPAELRPKYLTFDVQAAAGSDPHFVACVERDSPLGRFMDRETEWGRSYLARLLVRKLDIQADAPCMVVLDCVGAKEK
ncbi:MAG: hypothetical protein JNM65_14740 [Verrucomicrobiaceae bacterium]|nr:hypothetical protein [Verrucomicrobiaceae bacterium]